MPQEHKPVSADRDYLDSRFDAIERILDGFDHRLFGNGQPGEIDKLWTAIEDNRKTADADKAATNERVNGLALRITFAAGGVLALVAFVEFADHFSSIAAHFVAK